MTSERQVLDEVQAAVHGESHFGPGKHIDLDFADGALTMAGEVPNVAIKKRLLATPRRTRR